MSGHNKWSTIKHKKGAKDAKRAKVFTRLIKEITVAARMGGGDPGGNPRLRLAIQAARGANMPGDNIERAIKKGTGELEGVSYEEISYEGYGPQGVALLVECVTDNTNRTVSEVRSTFNKRGGKMGEPGSVAWMFESKGKITVARDSIDFDSLFEAAVEAGADDVEDGDDEWLVMTAREDLYAVEAALAKAGVKVGEAVLTQVPSTTVELTEVTKAAQVLRLVDALEESDDVQNVYANFDVTDEVAAALAEAD